MLNERDSRTAQPSLPTVEDTTPRIAVKRGRELTVFPDWLNEYLEEYAVHEMPGATMSEVVVRCVTVGVGALDAVSFARRMTAPAKPTPAPEPEVVYPFDRKHIPAFRALLAAVEGGPLTLDAVGLEPITGRMGSASLRGVGTFMSCLARKSPVAGLCVEALGRKPGRVTMDYRISKAG